MHWRAPQTGGRAHSSDGRGRITLRNVQRIVDSTRINEIHLSARTSVESGMSYRNQRVSMGGALRSPEFSWKATDESMVRSIVQLVHS